MPEEKKQYIEIQADYTNRELVLIFHTTGVGVDFRTKLTFLKATSLAAKINELTDSQQKIRIDL